MNGSIGKIGWLLLLALALAAPSVSAAEQEQEQERRERSRFELGLFTGFIAPDAALIGVPDPAIEPTLGLRLGGGISVHWNWFADLQLAQFETQTFAGDADMVAGRAGVELLIQPGGRVEPFFSGGWGTTQMGFEAATDYDSGFASLGLGQHIQIGGKTRLRWEVRVDRMLSSNGLRGADLTHPQATVGFNWLLGKGKLDHDRDGVAGHRDQCAGTPLGAAVDHRGCPTDADRDGVWDGLDACAETPREWPVALDGCPTDEDGDGVADGGDSCPGTPAGLVVNSLGCPLDSDGDGVFDGPDRCPKTIGGIEVGSDGCFLDADKDGVYDGLGMDHCLGTPPGTKVDTFGCPI